ncbi:hypothetical protein HDV00_008372 [Rhizophlyctis rosea]|nr:hypothetical protein HDV00_008372 [Rhizophlyctis rosea]
MVSDIVERLRKHAEEKSSELEGLLKEAAALDRRKSKEIKTLKQDMAERDNTIAVLKQERDMLNQKLRSVAEQLRQIGTHYESATQELHRALDIQPSNVHDHILGDSATQPGNGKASSGNGDAQNWPSNVRIPAMGAAQKGGSFSAIRIGNTTLPTDSEWNDQPEQHSSVARKTSKEVPEIGLTERDKLKYGSPAARKRLIIFHPAKAKEGNTVHCSSFEDLQYDILHQYVTFNYGAQKEKLPSNLQKLLPTTKNPGPGKHELAALATGVLRKDRTLDITTNDLKTAHVLIGMACSDLQLACHLQCQQLGTAEIVREHKRAHQFLLLANEVTETNVRFVSVRVYQKFLLDEAGVRDGIKTICLAHKDNDLDILEEECEYGSPACSSPPLTSHQIQLYERHKAERSKLGRDVLTQTAFKLELQTWYSLRYGYYTSPIKTSNQYNMWCNHETILYAVRHLVRVIPQSEFPVVSHSQLVEHLKLIEYNPLRVCRDEVNEEQEKVYASLDEDFDQMVTDDLAEMCREQLLVETSFTNDQDEEDLFYHVPEEVEKELGQWELGAVLRIK